MFLIQIKLSRIKNRRIETKEQDTYQISLNQNLQKDTNNLLSSINVYSLLPIFAKFQNNSIKTV